MKSRVSRVLSALKVVLLVSVGLAIVSPASANMRLLQEVKIADRGLHFDGKRVSNNSLKAGKAGLGSKYNYKYRADITATGDSIKTYKHYVFMGWYKGGKIKRQLMLSRYDTLTGSVKTIEFPHRHVGLKGQAFVGDSQSTVAIGVSPINGTIHLVYDLHGYSTDLPEDGRFANDYFRYSYSIPSAAEVSDDEFALSLFVPDTSEISEGPDDYKHLTMTGSLEHKENFDILSAPVFHLAEDGTLLFNARKGGNNNGAYVFNRYDAATQTWTDMYDFNMVHAKKLGNSYNWSPYGDMKYLNGKFRVAFQQRTNINWDKFKYQNGLFYAYSDHPYGERGWKNHKGQVMTFPLVKSNEIKVSEPGDFIKHNDKNSVHMASGFHWTVTDRGDIHMFTRVRSADRNRADFQDIFVHSYKPAGSDKFIHAEGVRNIHALHSAGGNVLIIGVDGDGYPYMKVARGGTNEFERVYQATSGVKFQHGQPYIRDGKLYYFLVERSEGASRPLYLQIIDLDLDSLAKADLPYPRINFPQPMIAVKAGYEKLSLEVDIESPETDRRITEASLYIDGKLIRKISSTSYNWGAGANAEELLNVPLGQHVLKVIAKDDTGLEGSSKMTLTVEPEAKPTVKFTQEAAEVNYGYRHLMIAVDAKPADDATPIAKVVLLLNGQVVRTDRVPPYVWGNKSRSQELLGMPVGDNELRVVVTDEIGQQSQDTMTVTVLPAR